MKKLEINKEQSEMMTESEMKYYQGSGNTDDSKMTEHNYAAMLFMEGMRNGEKKD